MSNDDKEESMASSSGPLTAIMHSFVNSKIGIAAHVVFLGVSIALMAVLVGMYDCYEPISHSRTSGMMRNLFSSGI